MSLLNTDLEKINFILSIYDNERKGELNSTLELLKDDFQSIIDEFANSFNLISRSSITQIKHFSIISRVKKTDSLREKFIRNNLINNFQHLDFPFNAEDPALVSTTIDRIREIDDLLGIRILTDLDEDCLNVFSFIKSPEFRKKANAKLIVLNQNDIDNQPKPMQNGLPIFKIKGTFRNIFNFELQIKSKLMNAWGDMEHSIFYKNYSVTPVRDNAQKAMNHVGGLLAEIDRFLLSIRNANKNFNDNFKEISFLSWLDSNYSSRVKASLNDISYKFDGLKEILFSVYSNLETTENIVRNNLRSEHFEFLTTSPTLNNYISLRNNNYDLKIAEAIILSWYLPPRNKITQNNINVRLQSFLDFVIESNSKFLEKDFGGYTNKELLDLLKLYVDLGLTYFCDGTFLLKLDEIKFFFKDCNNLSDYAEPQFPKLKIKRLKQIMFIQKYKGDLTMAINNLFQADQDELNVLITKLANLTKIQEHERLSKSLNDLQNISKGN